MRQYDNDFITATDSYKKYLLLLSDSWKFILAETDNIILATLTKNFKLALIANMKKLEIFFWLIKKLYVIVFLSSFS